MSKIGDYVIDFLEECGHDLGYSETLLPKLHDMPDVRVNRIPVWKYMGCKSEKQYYGG